MSGFRKSSRGIHATLNPVEVDLLRHVISELLDLLRDDGSPSHSDDPLAQAVGITTNDRLPEDPALARLLPDAYENPEHAGEFRRYTELGLREGKVLRLESVLSDLGSAGPQTLVLTPEQAEIWSMAINDIRLTLGVRLQVDEAAETRFAALPDDDPQKAAYGVFAWLGWMQQTLVEALTT